MQNYELLYILSNQYTEVEVGKIKEKIDGQIKKIGGVIGFEENLGKRKLAYPIKKVNHGYYLVTEFELEDGNKLKEFNESLRLDAEIVRAQIIKKHKITPEEIARQKSQREKFEKGEEAKNYEEKKSIKSAEATKGKMKDLDEKIDEILKEEVV